MKRICFFIILLILVVFSLLQVRGQFLSTENPIIGEQAPDFTLKTLSGMDKNMTKFRDGNNAIIFFWTTWCPYCLRELQELVNNFEDIKKRNIKLLLVNAGESAKQVRSFLDRNKINFEVFLDLDSSLSRKYGIVGIPTFFFVGEDGAIKAIENSLPDNYEKILNRARG